MFWHTGENKYMERFDDELSILCYRPEFVRTMWMILNNALSFCCSYCRVFFFFLFTACGVWCTYERWAMGCWTFCVCVLQASFRVMRRVMWCDRGCLELKFWRTFFFPRGFTQVGEQSFGDALRWWAINTVLSSWIRKNRADDFKQNALSFAGSLPRG